MPSLPIRARLALVFVATASFLWWLLGHRIQLNIDEGIYFDGAVRILSGSLPYRDFFAITGPGTFWNLALLFKLFGVTLSSARLLLVSDLSLLATCIYWLATKFLAKGAGLWLSGIYVGLLFLNPGNLAVNHRWDSAALAILAACLFYQALETRKAKFFVLAGVAAGYACIITPPAFLFLVVMLGWLVVVRAYRSALILATGATAVTTPVLCYLLYTHSLSAMARQLLWNTTRYSAANQVFYGAVVGGYGALFSGFHGADLLLRSALVALLLVPATALPFAILALLVQRRSLCRLGLLLLIFAAVATVACYPKMDISHLQFAFGFALLFAAFTLPGRLRVVLASVLTFGALLFAGVTLDQRLHSAPLESRVGRLVGDSNAITFAKAIQTAVKPGESLFVFPYLPLAYFLTGGKNPTRYSYLQPGMMNTQDEADAVSDLERNPPLLVLYSHVDAAAYLRVFPSSRPQDLAMPRIESWLAANYSRDPTQSLAGTGFDLLVKNRARSPYPVVSDSRQQPAEPLPQTPPGWPSMASESR